MTTIRPATIQEAVLAELRRLLLTGEITPGEHIKQEHLAERLGVSPVPLREALQVLQGEGLVEHRPGRGFRAPTLTREEIVELDLIARLLEREAFRRGVPRMTGDDLDRMERLFERLRELEGSSDHWEQVRIHRELHFVPVEAAGLPRLAAELGRLWGHIDHHRVLYVFKRPEVSQASLHQHGDIIAACRTGDPEAVIAVHEAHRDAALETILENFPA